MFILKLSLIIFTLLYCVILFNKVHVMFVNTGLCFTYTYQLVNKYVFKDLSHQLYNTDSSYIR